LEPLLTVVTPWADEDQLTQEPIKPVTVLVAPLAVDRIQRISNRALVFAAVRGVVVEIDVALKAGI
jgi:hypothetical protein